MTDAGPPIRVAVVGAGPAGIHLADTLLKSGTPATIDLFDRLPAPFGLVRYGVAPDHLRIKQIVYALHRVLDQPGVHERRGPVGLIGHTKGCAIETTASLLADLGEVRRPVGPGRIEALLDGRGVEYTTWDGWLTLDKHERGLGEEQGRERVKVVPRDEMVTLSRGG